MLNGKSEYEELNGNVCGVKIYRDITQIYDGRKTGVKLKQNRKVKRFSY